MVDDVGSFMTAEQVLERLPLIHNDFMNLILQDHPEVFVYMTEVLFGQGHLELALLLLQLRMISPFPGGKDIVLDALGFVKQLKSWVDLEFDPSGHRIPKERGEFYLDALTLWSLKKGNAYTELAGRFVIFLMHADEFGQGKPIYKIGMQNYTLDEPLRNVGEIWYVNGRYKAYGPLGDMLYHLFTPTLKSIRPGLLKDISEEYKTPGKEGFKRMTDIVQQYARNMVAKETRHLYQELQANRVEMQAKDQKLLVQDQELQANRVELQAKDQKIAELETKLAACQL